VSMRVWNKIEILFLKADSRNFKYLHFLRHLAKIILCQSAKATSCTMAMVAIVYLYCLPEGGLSLSEKF